MHFLPRFAGAGYSRYICDFCSHKSNPHVLPYGLVTEDDMSIDIDTKTKLLLNFHKSIEQEGFTLSCKFNLFSLPLS